jgi:hypothetical protein
MRSLPIYKFMTHYLINKPLMIWSAAPLSLHMRRNIIYVSPQVGARQAGPTSDIAPVGQLCETLRGQQLSVETRQQDRYLSKQKQSSEVDHSRPNKGVDPRPNADAG